MLFPKLGDAFSYAGRHFFCTAEGEAKERDCFVFITIGTRKGLRMGMGKKRDENPVPYVVRPKRGSLLFSLIQKHNLLLLLDDIEKKKPLFLCQAKGAIVD